MVYFALAPLSVNFQLKTYAFLLIVLIGNGIGGAARHNRKCVLPNTEHRRGRHFRSKNKGGCHRFPKGCRGSNCKVIPFIAVEFRVHPVQGKGLYCKDAASLQYGTICKPALFGIYLLYYRTGL